MYCVREKLGARRRRPLFSDEDQQGGVESENFRDDGFRNRATVLVSHCHGRQCSSLVDRANGERRFLSPFYHDVLIIV